MFSAWFGKEYTQNVLSYRSIRERGVQGKEHDAAFNAKCLFSFHSK